MSFLSYLTQKTWFKLVHFSHNYCSPLQKNPMITMVCKFGLTWSYNDFSKEILEVLFGKLINSKPQHGVISHWLKFDCKTHFMHSNFCLIVQPCLPNNKPIHSKGQICIAHGCAFIPTMYNDQSNENKHSSQLWINYLLYK